MKIERITDENDPDRCQGNNQHGQCQNKVVPGCNYCPVHGGASHLKQKQEKELNNYRLTKFKVRAAELGNNPKINTLKDEVAILRLLIEQLVNHCADETELLLRSGPLSDLVIKCQKLVCECQRLEEKGNNLWGREKVVQAAQIIVEIVGNHIDDSDLLEQIATEIIEALDAI